MIFVITVVALVAALAIEHVQNNKRQQILIEYAKAVEEKCEIVSKQHDACKELVESLQGWYTITGIQYAQLSAEIKKIKEET